MSEFEPKKDIWGEDILKDLATENMRESLALFTEAEETNDKSKKVFAYSQWATKYLARHLGVENLSSIEGVELRNTIEELFPKFEAEKELVAKGEMSGMDLAQLEEEASSLWLFRTYGIHPKDIPTIVELDDATDGKQYIFQKVAYENAMEKYDELEKAGHDFFMMRRVPEDFKEYLKRLRENAHGAEAKEPKK